MKRILFFLLLLINIGVFGQTTGDYRTMGTASFSATTNWQTYNTPTADGTWQTATVAPANVGTAITSQAVFTSFTRTTAATTFTQNTHGSQINSGTTVITLSAANASIVAGLPVTGTGIPNTAYVVSYNAATPSITISVTTTANIAAGTTLTFGSMQANNPNIELQSAANIAVGMPIAATGLATTVVTAINVGGNANCITVATAATSLRVNTTVTVAGLGGAGNVNVYLSASNASIAVGQLITGTNIAGGTYVAAISGQVLTMSQGSVGTNTGPTLSFFSSSTVIPNMYINHNTSINASTRAPITNLFVNNASSTNAGTGAVYTDATLTIGNDATARSVTAGTITVASNAAIVVVTGGNANNSLGLTGTGVVLNNSGTITLGTSTNRCNISFGGSGGMSITGSGTYNFNNFSVASSASLTVSSANITVNGTFNNAGTFVAPSGNLNFAGTPFTNTGTFTHNNGTVFFNGGVAQTIASGVSFFNLTTSTASTSVAMGGQTINILGNLIVGDGTTFTISNTTISVTGTTTVGGGSTGILALTSTTGTKTFTGLVTISTGGTWNNSGNSTSTFQGGITNNGTFTAGTGVQTFNTNTQALTGTMAIPSMTVTGITVTNNGTLTVATALSGTGGLTQAANSTLNISGTSGITTLIATNSGNTVNYNGTGAQTIKVADYHHLTISGVRASTPTITWGSGTINVAGALNVNYTNTVNFTTTGSTVNLTGSVSSTLSSATSFQILSVGTSATLITSVATTINGSAAINGTFQLNSGGSISAAPTYGSASHLIYNTTYGTFNEWTGGASASVAAGSGVPANVTVQSGTVTLGGGRGIPGNLTVNSGCGFVLNATSGDLYIGGNLTNNGSTWTNNTRAVFFVGTGTSVVTAGSGTKFFDYLIIAKSSGSVQVHSSTNITINTTSGDVLQFTNAGTLDLNGRTLTFNNSGGNISVNGATGGTAKSITSSTSANIAITNSKTVVNASSGTLSIGANITVTLTGGFNCGSSLTTINGTLRINSGGFINTNAPIYGATSTLQYNSGTTYGRSTEWTATTGTVGATVALPASVQISNNTTLNYPNGSSSPPRTLSGNLTIDAGSSLYMDFGSPSSTGALTVGGNVTLNGNLSLGNQNGGDIYVGGNWSHGAGTFAANNRAVFLNGANAQTITNTNGTNESFPFLIINNTSGGVSLNSPVTVTNTLTITNGILTTTTTNLLSVTNTANTAVVATTSFSATRFINGPLAWTLPASSGNTYIFPVGAGSSYYPLSLASPTTSTAGTTVVRVQSFTSNSGGSADGTTLASISPNEYWSITASVGNVTGGTISLTRTGVSIGSFNAIGASTTLTGTYVSIGGTASGSSINTSNAISTINAGSTGFYVLGIIASADPSITTITGGLTGTSGYIGQTLTINGLNFTSGATVTFNGGSAIATTFVDATQLTVVVPASATTGNIVVTSNSVQTAPYSYTILGYITTQAGDWNTNTTWLGGAIPPINTNTTIDHAVTINSAVADPATSITINASRSLTFGASGSITVTTITNNGTISMASGGTITVAASGTLANNATFTHGAGTIVLTNGTSTFTGITQLNNITINAGYNFSGITINGILQLNAGAFVNTTAPTYATGSTLRYNTGGTYGRTTEWTATSGVGYPHHVQISNNTILDIGANSGGATARQIGGNLTIDVGSTFTMAGGTSAFGSQAMSTELTVLGSVINNGTLTLSGTSGGDIYIAANWTHTGTFNANNRAVFFNGSSNSTINSATTFSFLLISKTGGASVTLDAATTVSNDLTISSGAVLDVSTSNFALNIGGNFSNSGTFTARNGTVTFNGSGTQTLSGSTTFYNLTETNAGTTLQLTAGTTQTIGNILTITGAAGNFSNAYLYNGFSSIFNVYNAKQYQY